MEGRERDTQRGREETERKDRNGAGEKTGPKCFASTCPQTRVEPRAWHIHNEGSRVREKR